MTANVEKTQAFYDALSQANLCSCEDCRRYYTRVRAAYPGLEAWLRALGADIEKPFELSLPTGPDALGRMEYSSSMYIVFGEGKHGFVRCVDDLEIIITEHHPDTGIKEPHFVIVTGPIFLKAE